MESRPLPKSISQSEDLVIDIVLHCGDVSECGTLEDYKNTFELLKSIAAPLKLVIPGNPISRLTEHFGSSTTRKEGRDCTMKLKRYGTVPQPKKPGLNFWMKGIMNSFLAMGRDSGYLQVHSRQTAKGWENGVLGMRVWKISLTPKYKESCTGDLRGRRRVCSKGVGKWMW